MIPRIRPLALTALAALTLLSNLPARAQTAPPAKPEAPAATAPPAPPKPVVVQPKRFASPDEAVQAFVAALRAADTKVLVAVLGSEGRTLVSSGDPVADRQSREFFLQAYDASSKLVPDGDRAVLQVGADDWPFPIPLVRQGERWRFDVRQGREEIVARRIGRNELYTMQTCLAYVDAQREYYSEDRNGDGILEYAQRFDSTPGKRDGLYWPTQPGELPSPLGELVVRARAAGYRREGPGPTPFHGYLYRILTAQGPAATDGAYEYLLRGHMIAGFALVAFPAQYGASGVMTFMVNHDGVVYQKDLGPSTRSMTSAMRTFNPDGTWERADVPDAGALTSSASR
jgi:Protein of unknown function (DUF2950)